MAAASIRPHVPKSDARDRSADRIAPSQAPGTAPVAGTETGDRAATPTASRIPRPIFRHKLLAEEAGAAGAVDGTTAVGEDADVAVDVDVDGMAPALHSRATATTAASPVTAPGTAPSHPVETAADITMAVATKGTATDPRSSALLPRTDLPTCRHTDPVDSEGRGQRPNDSASCLSRTRRPGVISIPSDSK